MCFQKAGDEHREKWARAADLVANGDRLASGNWRRAQTFFVEAAEIYDSIGKHEKAASCLIKSKDFKKAGWSYCYNISFNIFYCLQIMFYKFLAVYPFSSAFTLTNFFRCISFPVRTT